MESTAGIESLLEGCMAADRVAQEKLYRLTAPRMYGICMRYADNSEDAQDILQNGFVKVFTQLDQFRRQGSFEGWIRRIMVHTAIEFLRKNKRLATAKDLWALSDDELLPMATTEDTLGYEELWTLIQELPQGYRAVFNMYVIEGYSHKEIATLLSISDGTSKSQLLRARRLLKQKIEKLKGENHDAKQAR